MGPEERDPTAEEEIGLMGLLKFILCLVVVFALAGKFITGSYTWEYESKWTQLKTFWPVSVVSFALGWIRDESFLLKTTQSLFSERYLSEFDGSIPGKPIYLAVSPYPRLLPNCGLRKHFSD